MSKRARALDVQSLTPSDDTPPAVGEYRDDWPETPGVGYLYDDSDDPDELTIYARGDDQPYTVWVSCDPTDAVSLEEVR